MSLVKYFCPFRICRRVFQLIPLNNSLDQGIFRGMDTLHERIYELSSEHIKTINGLAHKYGGYADSSPDFEKPPVHIIVGNWNPGHDRGTIGGP